MNIGRGDWNLAPVGRCTYTTRLHAQATVFVVCFSGISLFSGKGFVYVADMFCI